MLKGVSSRPAFRIGSVLVTVAVAGGLIGMGLEEVRYGGSTELERAEAAADAVEQEARTLRRSRQDEAILARTLSYFPPYPNGGRPEALAADYLGPDAPIAVAFFETKDSSDQVLQHYRKFLLDKGLPVVGLRFNQNAGYVGYWSPSTEEVRLMSTMRQGDTTEVFVSTARVASYLERDSQVPSWVPVPPSLKDATSLSLRMEGSTQVSVSGLVPAAALPEVEQQFREALRARGWTVSESTVSGFQESTLDVTHTGLRGQAMLRQPTAQPQVEFYLTLMKAGQAAP
ncbi:hypothetical protein [Corallococcus aberystwythensis]|uniref:Uncharacterized protein n=1 Tax=Corallococcus aberystwythensis TaxID=2316722 RepID=A0A3A8PVN6_9BACT|nr:hypothetical protein [Corallococcus aberystwythensis]RKH56442.1 hypothetical protein D7W81_33805 [Corallococcus aberystwythensis]